MKDGPKNRLREQDIHKIVDVFNKQLEVPKYSRMIPVAEIADEKNNYNLNIPRYIDSQEAEDIQDIEAHLLGDIPNADIEALENYWSVYPSLQNVLFTAGKRKNYCKLKIDDAEIKQTIFSHPEFTAYTKKVNEVFTKWKNKSTIVLKKIGVGVKPKKLIHELSEDLLQHFTDLNLIDKYDVYQHLMTYWMETMQDDAYEIAADDWKTGGIVYRIMKSTKDKEGKTKEKQVEGMDGIESKLIKPYLLINKYFVKEKDAIEKLEAEKDELKAKMDEMEEEYSVDEGLFAELDKLNKANAQKRLKEIKGDKEFSDEQKALEAFLILAEKKADTEKKIKDEQKALEKKVWDKYSALSIDEIKTIVVDDKWMATMYANVQSDMQRISQRLTQRIKELAERYEYTMPQLTNEVKAFEEKINNHLRKMEYSW
jgi:type I restriction enzyme M protein